MKELGEELQQAALRGDGGLRPWQAALALGLVAALYLGVGVFDHSIWAPTEPTVAGIVWNMEAHDDLAVPRVNEYPYLEKPPLYYWLALGACKLGGRLSAGFIRFPATLMGILCLALAGLAARKQYGGRAACLAVLAGATLTSFWEYAHRASTDIAATFFCFLCFAVFAGTIGRSGPASRTRRWDIAFALALATSFYSKNFYTYLIVYPPVFLFLAYKREFRRIACLSAWLAAFTVVLLIPWCLALYGERGWEYLQVVFVDNTVGRFFHMSAPPRVRANALYDAYETGRTHTVLFYPAVLAALVKEWPLLFVAACIHLARKWRSADDFDRFLAIGIVALPVVLTLSSSKSVEYLTPVLFFVVLIIARFLGELLEAGTAGRWEKRLVAANVVLLGTAAFAMPEMIVLVTGHYLPLAWVPACALFLIFLAIRPWPRWSDFTFLYCSFCFLAAALLVALVSIMPYADAEKTTAPFFDAIRKESSRVELFTTFRDDRSLPLITYSLRRRVGVIENEGEVFDLLASGRKVGIITPRDFYRANRARLAGLPYVHIEAPQGKEIFSYIGSAAGSALDAPDQ